MTPESLKDDAIESLDAQKRTIYAYQRVEIRGILSPNTADNDTNDRLGPVFDRMIVPTHLGENTVGPELPPWFKAANTGFEALEDLASLNRDARDQISSAAEEAVKQLAGKEVNEIVAHSWGTEIVYNAILTGKIRPPRQLLVCGMPDRDLEKWRALAKFTGTKVIVYTNSGDPVAGAARMGQDANTAVAAAALALNIKDRAILNHGPGGEAAKFELQWQEACREIVCNPLSRPAAEAVYRNDYVNGTHDRFEYYYAAQDAHDLAAAPLDESLTHKFTAFPGSYLALKVAQDQLIGKEERRLYAEEIKEEAAHPASPDPESPEDGADAFWGSAQSGAALEREAQAGNAADAASQAADREAKIEYEQREADARRDAERREYDYIMEAVALDCSNPELFRSQIESGAGVDAEINTEALIGFFNEDMSRDGSKSWGIRPNSCQETLMRRIIAAKAPVSTEESVQWALDYRRAHPSLLHRLAANVGDFIAAVHDILAVNEQDSSGGGSVDSGDETSPSRSSGGGRRSDPAPRNHCAASQGGVCVWWSN